MSEDGARVDNVQGALVLRLRDQVLPIADLGRFLGFETSPARPGWRRRSPAQTCVVGKGESVEARFPRRRPLGIPPLSGFSWPLALFGSSRRKHLKRDTRGVCGEDGMLYVFRIRDIPRCTGRRASP